MKNRNLESRIGKVQELIALWAKFHDLYQSSVGKEAINPEDEKSFLELKSELAMKYESVSKELELDAQTTGIAFGVITQAVSLSSISKLPEIQLRSLESDWHGSYIALNKLMGDLGTEKNELSKVSGVKVSFNKLVAGPLTSLIILILVILVVFTILVKFFNVDEKLPKLLNNDSGKTITMPDESRIMFKWEEGEK